MSASRVPVNGWYPPADLPDDMLEAWRANVPDRTPEEARAAREEREAK